MKYKVYYIKYRDMRIYYGYTNDLKRRTYEHNYNLRKGKNILLYNKLKEFGIDSVELEVVKEFNNKVEAKRYECFLILREYFNECGDPVKLWQKVPSIGR